MERLGSLGTAVPRTHFSKTVIEGSVPGRGKHARASFHTCPSLDSSCFFPGTNVLIGRIEKAILKSCSVGSKLKWMKTYRELASLNRKQYAEFLCAWCRALDSLTAALPDFQSGIVPPLGAAGVRTGPNRLVWLFRCTRTSKLNALPTHFPGFKVCMTGSTAGPAIYQL